MAQSPPKPPTKAAKRQMTITIAVSVLILAAMVGTATWMAMRQAKADQAELLASKAEDHRLAIARRVVTLPQGVEAAWTDYVEKRLEAELSRQGDVVRVVAATDMVQGSVAYMSTNTSYVVRCSGNPLSGAKVEFGQGDGAMTVIVFGRGGPLDDPSNKAPSLGVDPDSIAAANLSENLCRRIAGYMQRLMSR